MKNRNLLLKFTLLVIMIGFVSSAFAQFSGGTGTTIDPYQLSTPADLQALKTAADYKYFILTADIDMTGETWEPLSSASHASQFRGSLNGDGHVIQNLSISVAGSAAKVGFIIEQAGGTYIKNLGFVNLTVDAPECTPVGGIIAYSWAGNNRIFEGNWVESGTITGKANVGSLAGWMFVKEASADKTQSLRNCYAGAGVTVSGNKEIGGLFGKLDLQTDGLVSDLAFFGTVTADSSASVIAGSPWKSIVDISDDFYYDSEKNDMAILNALPGGAIAHGNAVGLTTSQLTDEANFPQFDFSSVWSMGAKHPILGEPVTITPVEELVSMVTDKHNGTLVPVGGTYAAGDTMTLTIKYNANNNTKLSIVLKTKESEFVDLVCPQFMFALPNTTEESTYEIKVGIPDSVSFTGDCRVTGYLGTWVQGTVSMHDYIVVGEADAFVEELTKIETDQHDATLDVVGGYYMPGDSIAFNVSYNSNSNSTLSIVLKEQPGFVNAVRPKIENIALPNTTTDTVVVIKVEIPDSVAYRGQVRVSSWIGTWSAGVETFEYIAIGEDVSAVKDLAIAEFIVYPNPASDFVQFILSDKSMVTLRDLSGRSVLSQAGLGGLNTMDLTSLTSGTYLMTVQSNGAVRTQTIQVK